MKDRKKTTNDACFSTAKYNSFVIYTKTTMNFHNVLTQDSWEKERNTLQFKVTIPCFQRFFQEVTRLLLSGCVGSLGHWAGSLPQRESKPIIFGSVSKYMDLHEFNTRKTLFI